MMRLTDAAIRSALTPADDVQAPAGLALQIRELIETTPQRAARPGWWPRSRRTTLFLQLAVVGLLLLALVAGLLLVGSHPPTIVSPPSVSTYHGGPARTGLMPGPGPVGQPVQAWEQTAAGAFGPGSPAVVGGVVYVADESGTISTFDERTGRRGWKWNLGSTINTGPTVDHGLVLIGANDGNEYALSSSANGAPQWSYRTGGSVNSSAVVLNGVVYFGSLDGSLYAIDEATGKPRWPAVRTSGPISRAIAEADGVLYAGSGGATPGDPGTLGAFAAATGRSVWAPRKVAPGNLSTPTIAGGHVYVTTGLDATSAGVHQLLAFDATTGTPAWASPFQVPSGKIVLIAAATDATVYAVSDDGSMYAIDAATGKQAWAYQIHASQSPSGGYVDGVLYLTSDDRNVYALDMASHLARWVFPVRGVPDAPTVLDGRVFVATSLGEVFSIEGSLDAAP
jgi:outer membrane protein assembly factor BamB